jgi:hypothetical protein
MFYLLLISYSKFGVKAKQLRCAIFIGAASSHNNIVSLQLKLPLFSLH